MRKSWKPYFLSKASYKIAFPLWTVHFYISRQSFPYAFIIKLCFFEAHCILLSHLSRSQPSHLLKSLHLAHDFSIHSNFCHHPGRFQKPHGQFIPSLSLSISSSPHHQWPSLWSSTFPGKHQTFSSLISPKINIHILRILLSDHY